MSIKNDSIDGASSISSSALMQKSTDTLVDESSLANKKVNDKINGIGMSNSITNKKSSEEENDEDDDLFDLNKNTSNNKLSCFRHGSNGSLILLTQKSDSSSTPLSSSIPSPASLTIHSNFIKKTNGIYTNGLNSVSTSTSGLSDYVTSAKFRMINDTIKYFERSFNEENNFYNNSNEISLKSNQFNSINENIYNSNSNNNKNLELNLKPNEKLNGKRQASNSIPIVKKNVILKFFFSNNLFDYFCFI